MSDEFTQSLREGETGGVPKKGPQAASVPHDKNPVVGRVKIGSVLEIPIHKDTADAALGKAMQVCKTMYENWKEKHPDATHTPIRYSQCSKEPAAPTVPDQRPPASKGQQH